MSNNISNMSVAKNDLEFVIYLCAIASAILAWSKIFINLDITWKQIAVPFVSAIILAILSYLLFFFTLIATVISNGNCTF